jgi:uncharacterized protein
MKLPYTFSELKSIKRKPFLVLLASAVCLLGLNFFSGHYQFEVFEKMFFFLGFGNWYESAHFLLNKSSYRQFWQLLYWAGHTLVFYFAVPSLLIRFILKERLRDYGLKIRGAFSFAGIYAIAFVLILPVVFYASFSSRFQITYPFFVPLDKNDMFPYFFIWEIFYVAQFFALEFFFRGFMIQGLKHDLGIYSVFVMTVPYCMIHFTKPLPECIGSIFAGVFLGLMSYKTNSVWLGALMHVGVAVSMDLLSLWHKGYF